MADVVSYRKYLTSHRQQPYSVHKMQLAATTFKDTKNNDGTFDTLLHIHPRQTDDPDAHKRRYVVALNTVELEALLEALRVKTNLL